MSEDPKNELTEAKDLFPVLQSDTMEVAELLEENLAGVGIDRFELERIKVGAGGVPGYSIVPPEEGAEQGFEREFEALVVHTHSCRTYFAKSFDDTSDEDGGHPDCQSNDAVTGVGDIGEGHGVRDCETCPMNQWGSETKRNHGKACREQKAIYLYRTGAESVFPSLLLVPPSSLKSWRSYTVGLVGKGIRLSQAVHLFYTKPDKSSAGKDYTKVAVRFRRKMDDSERESLVVLGDSIKGLISGSTPSAGGPPPQVGQKPANPVRSEGFDPNDEIPF